MMFIDPYRFGAAAGGDPHFASVVLLLHMDGVNGEHVYPDSSSYARFVDETGTASTGTAVKKWGTAALNRSSGDGFLWTADSPSMELGSADWTFECWMYANASNGGLLTKGQVSGGAVFPLSINLESSGLDSRFRLRVSTDGTTLAVDELLPASGSAYSTGVWHHVAVVRDGSTLRVFVDGVGQGTASISGAIHNSTDQWVIGRSHSAVPFQGYLDEMRLTIGVARYSSDFTPPSDAFPDA